MIGAELAADTDVDGEPGRGRFMSFSIGLRGASRGSWLEQPPGHHVPARTRLAPRFTGRDGRMPPAAPWSSPTRRAAAGSAEADVPVVVADVEVIEKPEIEQSAAAPSRAVSRASSTLGVAFRSSGCGRPRSPPCPASRSRARTRPAPRPAPRGAGAAASRCQASGSCRAERQATPNSSIG